MALKVQQNKIHMDESSYMKDLASKDKGLKDCFRMLSKLQGDPRMAKAENSVADECSLSISETELHESINAKLKALVRDCHTIKSLLPKTPK